MISEKQIKLINKIASKDTFKYTGDIIQGVDQPGDIDYKFTITGHKKMMSVGEYYDYLLLKVVITGVHDPVSKLIFTPEPTDVGKSVARAFESQLYRFYSSLNQEIMEYLKYFNDSGEEFVRTTIDDLSFDLKKPENITESRMSRVAIRTTVTDIVNILKNGKSGEFRLPDVDDGGEYNFTNLPFGYSLDLYVVIDNDIEKYEMNGRITENDVIQIIVKFNPKTLRRNFYNIIGELNDMVAHELEHLYQYFRGEYKFKKQSKKSFKYYTEPQEVGAQRIGFRRVAKLRKLPYNDVVIDWFETHKDVHGLTDDEIEEVIKIILNDK